jgi:phage gp36-like protein
MAYLLPTDYDDIIQSDNLNQIIENDPAILISAESKAQAKIRSTLISRYDIDSEFSKSGSDREPNIVRIYCTIALYFIYKRISYADVPENREKDYNSAIEELKGYITGEGTPNLTQKEAFQGQTIRYGSNEQREHYW